MVRAADLPISLVIIGIGDYQNEEKWADMLVLDNDRDEIDDNESQKSETKEPKTKNQPRDIC